MPVLSLACHLPHNTPNIPSRYNNEQTTKQTKAINNSYIYIYISCKCDTNRAGHFTFDAYASRPVACFVFRCESHAESCMMNHCGSAASMETEGSLFRRSMERHVRYDCKNYSALPLCWPFFSEIPTRGTS